MNQLNGTRMATKADRQAFATPLDKSVHMAINSPAGYVLRIGSWGVLVGLIAILTIK